MTTTAPLPPIQTRRRGRGLAQELVAELSQRIHSGEFPPGAKLPTENEISQHHGVSRTVVREAISRMQAAGVVETRHGIGTFVLEPQTATELLSIDPANLTTIREIIAILDLRIALETEAASLAALHRSEEQLKEMTDTLNAFNAGIAQDNCVEADIRFHLLVAQSTGNAHFASFMKYLGEAVIPRTRINTAQLIGEKREEYLQHLNHEHLTVFNAIRRQDPEAARAAMRTHLANSRERLMRVEERLARGQAGASGDALSF